MPLLRGGNKENHHTRTQFRRGALAGPSPQGCPAGARPSQCPTAAGAASPRSARGQIKEGRQLLPRRLPAKTLPRTVVQIGVDPLEFRRAAASQGRRLGMAPADQPVGVFVRAPLPRVIGVGEKHGQDGRPRKSFVRGKLLAVV